MGYWMFIFDHDQWYDLYEKNCSLKTQDEWLAEGKPNFFIGLAYFLAGLVFEVGDFWIKTKTKPYYYSKRNIQGLKNCTFLAVVYTIYDGND